MVYECQKAKYVQILKDGDKMIAISIGLLSLPTIVLLILSVIIFYCYLVCNEGESRATAFGFGLVYVGAITFDWFLLNLMYLAHSHAILIVAGSLYGGVSVWLLYKNWAKYHFWTTVLFASIWVASTAVTILYKFRINTNYFQF